MIAAALLAVAVVVGPQPSTTPATFPVEDLTFPDPTLTFAEASVDGAVTDTGGRAFRLNSDVLFAFDKATLNARAEREITDVAAKLKMQTDGAKPVTTVSVTGFTDDQGSDGYNLGLSKRRAEAVRSALSQALGRGVTVRAIGRGEADPIAKNSTAAGRKLNRRVEIRAS